MEASWYVGSGFVDNIDWKQGSNLAPRTSEKILFLSMRNDYPYNKETSIIILRLFGTNSDILQYNKLI